MSPLMLTMSDGRFGQGRLVLGGGAEVSLVLPIPSAGENIYPYAVRLGSSRKLCVGLIISIYFVWAL